MAPPRKLEILEVFSPADIDRFWLMMEPENGDACRNWLGKTTDGYGAFRVAGRTWRANRVAWTLFHGKEMGNLFRVIILAKPKSPLLPMREG